MNVYIPAPLLPTTEESDPFMDDLFTGDLLFVKAQSEGGWAKLRAELSAWWSGSRFNDVAVVVRDPSDTTRIGVVLMEHSEPRFVPIEAWLRSRSWDRVVVRRTTPRSLPYYAPLSVGKALVGVDLHRSDGSPNGRGIGYLPRWFEATEAAEGPFTPRDLGSATDATAWAESGLYEPDALLCKSSGPFTPQRPKEDS